MKTISSSTQERNDEQATQVETAAQNEFAQLDASQRLVALFDVLIEVDRDQESDKRKVATCESN